MAVLLNGKNGCGKGRLTDALREVNFLPLAMSATLNKVKESNSEWEFTIDDHQRKGLYVPDSIMLPVIDLVFGDFSAHSQIVIDGGTRTQAQAELFYKHLRKLDYKIFAFYLDTPHQICVDRSLNRGRMDDTEEIIMRRFGEFKEHTEPAIEWMRKQTEPFITINGTETLEVKITELFTPLGLLGMASGVTQIVEQKINEERHRRQKQQTV